MNETTNSVNAQAAVMELLLRTLQLADIHGLYVRVDQVMNGSPAMGNTRPVVIVEPKYQKS